MPNHIQNRIEFIGSRESIVDARKLIESGEGDNYRTIDFNNIIKMPEDLDIESGSVGSTAFEALFDDGDNGDAITKLLYGNANLRQVANLDRLLKLSLEDRVKSVEMGLKYYHNKVKYGHTTWYEWNTANWGTKWNAYDTDDKRNTESVIYFQTAWASPVDLIRKMSEMIPNVKVCLSYSDEDSGSNTGVFEFLGGEIMSQEVPDSQSDRAYEIYFDLHPGREEDFEYVNNQWKYKEDDE